MRFKINYRDELGELQEVEKEFFDENIGTVDDPEMITAWQWAHDWAYSAANKGWYMICEILK